MSDLVKRLRELALDPRRDDELRESADKIEKLLAAQEFLFNAPAVLAEVQQHGSERAAARISSEIVNDVLDAVIRLQRRTGHVQCIKSPTAGRC